MHCRAWADRSVLFLAVSLSALGAAQDDVVFRSGVSLVRVDAAAVDTTGAVIPGLKKEEFRILDEGKEQKIVNFSFAEEPLDLILLFDTAGSMHGKLLELMRATQLGFNELHEGDRVSVWVFGSTPAELLPFSDNLEKVNQAIVLRALTLRPNGSSKLEPAADAAAMRFVAELATRRKRAILVVTDKSAAHGSSQTPVVRNLWNADAVLSELIMDHPGPPPRMLDHADDIVEKTGGAAIVAGDPGEAFRQSVHYLRSGYTMYYALPGMDAASPHAITVDLAPEAAARFPGVRIRARSGYLAVRQSSSARPAAK